MIRLLCIVLLTGILLPVTAQDKKAQKHNLKSITGYEQKFDKGKGGKVLMESQVTYDQEGNVIEEAEYKDGKLVKRFTYQYNGENDKIKETEFDALGNKVRITEFKYKDGLRTEKAVYNGSGQLLSKKTIKYETY